MSEQIQNNYRMIEMEEFKRRFYPVKVQNLPLIVKLIDIYPVRT